MILCNTAIQITTVINGKNKSVKFVTVQTGVGVAADLTQMKGVLHLKPGGNVQPVSTLNGINNEIQR